MNRKSRGVKGLTPLGRKWVIAASNDMRRRLGLEPVTKAGHYKKRRKSKRRKTKRRKTKRRKKKRKISKRKRR